MTNKKTLLIDEDMVNTIGQSNLELIQTNGDEMEKEMARTMEKIKSLQYTGYAEDKQVAVTINGDYQVLDIAIDSNFNWTNDQTKTLNLVIEAINAANNIVDLEIETQISTIEYEYFGKVMKTINAPIQYRNKFKESISKLKKND